MVTTGTCPSCRLRVKLGLEFSSKAVGRPEVLYPCSVPLCWIRTNGWITPVPAERKSCVSNRAPLTTPELPVVVRSITSPHAPAAQRPSAARPKGVFMSLAPRVGDQPIGNRSEKKERVGYGAKKTVPDVPGTVRDVNMGNLRLPALAAAAPAALV